MAPKFELVRELLLDNDVTAIAWSPDGKLIATSEKSDTVIKVWEAASASTLHVVQKQNKGSSRLIFTADGKFIITSSVRSFDGISRTALSIIDVSTGAIVRNIDGPYNPSHFPRADAPRDFALSPDGQHLYVTFNTPDQMIYIYDVSSWSEVGFFPSMAFVMRGGPRDDELTMVGADGTARVWGLSQEKAVIRTFTVMKTYPESMALDRTTCRLATGKGPRIDVFDQTTQKFVSGVDPRPIRIWDINSGIQVDAAAVKDPVRGLSFSPDGMLLAAATGDYGIVLYNAKILVTSVVIYRFTENALGVMFSPDGRYLAAAGDARVLLFKVK